MTFFDNLLPWQKNRLLQDYNYTLRKINFTKKKSNFNESRDGIIYTSDLTFEKNRMKGYISCLNKHCMKYSHHHRLSIHSPDAVE